MHNLKKNLIVVTCAKPSAESSVSSSFFLLSGCPPNPKNLLGDENNLETELKKIILNFRSI